MILIAQLVTLALLAGWLSLALRDDLFHPMLGKQLIDEVVSMSRLKPRFPEAYRKVQHRRITEARTDRLIFRAIVAWQAAAVVILWWGVGALALAALDLVMPATAHPLAVAGALMFTVTWALLLIAGNHFCYWYVHEAAQNTHLQLVLWGTAVLLLQALLG